MNTVVAAAGVGANFSSAKFLDFYRADFNYENGIYVEGLGSKGTTRGRHRIGSPSDAASVEFENGHIDVDLYHPSKDIGSVLGAIILGKGGLSRHWGEVSFNKRHKRGTHPGDVVKRFEDLKVINTGVSCKRE